MTEEQKQALIEHIETDLELLRNVTLKHCHEVERECVLRDIEANEIALAALTAPPVKLPQIIQIGYTHDEITAMCNVRNDAVAAIRAAGHQVESE